MWRKEQTLHNSKQWKIRHCTSENASISDQTSSLSTTQCHWDDEGKESTNFQHKVHMSPSGPSIIPPEFPVPPPRLKTEKPRRVDKGGPSSNLRSRGKKNPIPLYALTAQFQKNMKTMQLPIKYLEWPGIQTYYQSPREENLVKILCKRIWTVSSRHQRVKGTSTVIFILKDQVPKEKK